MKRFDCALPPCRLFVARPNNAMGHHIYHDLLAPALAAARLQPVHGSFGESRRVASQVSTAIQSCHAVLAVLAGQNRNVYIEAGIAIALRKPVILVVDADQDAGMLCDYPLVRLGEPARLQMQLKRLSCQLLAGETRSCEGRVDP